MSQPDKSNNPTGQGQQPQNQLLDYYQNWVNRTPFITRNFLITIFVVYLISWIYDADKLLGNIPYYTIQYFEFYRIILSPLVGNSILSVILILFVFPELGGRLESSMGSLTYLTLILTLSIITNIVFVAICYLLYVMSFTTAIILSCEGFWTIIFAFITIECMQMPDVPRQFLFIPINIPSKYFPLAMYAFFSLFGGLDLGYAVSIFIGYIYSKGWLDKLQVPQSWLIRLEQPDGLFFSLSRYTGWVLNNSSVMGNNPWLPVNTADSDDHPQASSHSSASTGNPMMGGFGNWANNQTSDETNAEKVSLNPKITDFSMVFQISVECLSWIRSYFNNSK